MIVTAGNVTVQTNDAARANDWRATVHAEAQTMNLSLGQARALMNALSFVLNPESSRGLFP